MSESRDDKAIGRLVAHADNQINMLENPKISRFDTIKAATKIYSIFSTSEDIKKLDEDQEKANNIFRQIGFTMKQIGGIMIDVKANIRDFDRELGALSLYLDKRKLQTTMLPEMVWDIDAMDSEIREIRTKLDETNASEKQVETLFNCLEAWGSTSVFKSAVSSDVFVANSVKKLIKERETTNTTLVEFQEHYASLIFEYKNFKVEISSNK